MLRSLNFEKLAGVAVTEVSAVGTVVPGTSSFQKRDRPARRQKAEASA
jgi:hypothetical protein